MKATPRPAITVLVPSYASWLVGAVLQGLGTAMVYPTLLAAITDHAHPRWRATSLGVYRFWRDLGYAVGALLSGAVADLVGLGAAIHLVALLTLGSGVVVVLASKTGAPRRCRRSGDGSVRPAGTPPRRPPGGRGGRAVPSGRRRDAELNAATRVLAPGLGTPRLTVKRGDQ